MAFRAGTANLHISVHAPRTVLSGDALSAPSVASHKALACQAKSFFRSLAGAACTLRTQAHCRPRKLAGGVAAAVHLEEAVCADIAHATSNASIFALICATGFNSTDAVLGILVVLTTDRAVFCPLNSQTALPALACACARRALGPTCASVSCGSVGERASRLTACAIIGSIFATCLTAGIARRARFAVEAVLTETAPAILTARETVGDLALLADPLVALCATVVA